MRDEFVKDQPSGQLKQGPLLAVTGSQQPYIFDLPHLLSLPNGFEFRFRYRPRWLDAQIVRRITDGSETFSGREMVILFHSQESKHLIPVRRGIVIGFEAIGPMILLRFRVGEFPKLTLAIDDYSRQTPDVIVPALASLSRLGKTLIGPIDDLEDYDLSNALPNGYYVRQSEECLSACDWSGGDDAAAWARLAAILHHEPALGGIPLFYVLGFKKETGDSISSSAVKNRFSITKEQIFGFPLVESERYRMRVVAWSEPPQTFGQPRIKVKCEYNADRLALEGASDLVVGRYDVIEFTFSARRSGYSEVVLRAEPLRTDDTDASGVAEDLGRPEWARWPTIFVARVPVIVRHRTQHFVLATLSIFVGLCIYMFVTPELGRVGKALELVALALLLVGGRFLGDVLNLTDNLNKLKGERAP